MDAFNGDGLFSAGTVQKPSNPGRNDGAQNQGKAFLKQHFSQKHVILQNGYCWKMHFSK